MTVLNIDRVGRGRNVDVEMDVWCCKDGQNKEWEN